MVTYFMFPETKGYSVEEIVEVFDGPGPVGQVSMSSGLKGDVDEIGEAENVD